MPSLKEEYENTMGNDYRGEAMYSEPLSKHTSLAIGGPADIYVVPSDAISLKKCILFAEARGIPILPLGGGTNLIVSDKGFRGMAISLKSFNMIKVINDGEEMIELFIESGMVLQRLIQYCIENGYGGIENLSGIPGTVGGAIIGNSGAYGQEMKDVVDSLVIIYKNGIMGKLDEGEFSFGYRTSHIPQDSIIVSANMTFKKTAPAVLKQKAAECLSLKKETQPLSKRSAGCVFKNPEGESAGKLIEKAGCKGMRIGDIEVSEIHANFFINNGKGSASDFMELMRIVKERVAEREGIKLEEEIKAVGNGYTGA